MDPEEELPNHVHGKAGRHMVQPDKAVRIFELILYVNIIFFSTPPERGNWNLV